MLFLSNIWGALQKVGGVVRFLMFCVILVAYFYIDIYLLIA